MYLASRPLSWSLLLALLPLYITLPLCIMALGNRTCSLPCHRLLNVDYFDTVSWYGAGLATRI